MIEKQQRKNNGIKIWFFEKINKIDNCLARQPKKEKERRFKSLTSGLNEGTLQTLQKLKGLYGNTMNNYMPTN